ncbi:MAG: hypothetical protein GY888_12930 [Planctomycetaceae bacterium]|nr:hypothetical protein [Planctomycetaceae bacterium]
MAIHVVCISCKKRFQVDDVHAGKTGPCPNCKKPIEIPRPEDAVVIHEPENLGPKDSSGRPVLKPIARQDTQVSPLQWILMLGSVAGVLLLCFFLRGTLQTPSDHLLLLGFGSLLLGVPLSLAGYSFLRDHELEAYHGSALWIRCAVCSVVYTLIWGLYAWTPQFFYIDDLEAIHVAIFLLPLCFTASIAPLAAFDLDYLFSFVHCVFFMVATSILAKILGIPLY